MPDPPEPSFRDEGRRPEGRVKKRYRKKGATRGLPRSAGMIAPANVCAQNHHKRASEGNGGAAERPRGAHLLAMEPRSYGCPTRRSRASGTRVGGRKDG
ncbi:hypothetical protein PIB30_110443 [Stylosanthes scabra]|uniref:Uncharacterized protein n=1 Tax=Stylosanthes scabra TaxID=79078 RepID=A0ABU6Y0P9_9FABA|nr:hypothetical protein [Stylosanthes scabra]